MHRLKVLAIACLAALMVSCTQGKPPRFQSWKNATGSEAYERLFWKAIEDADFAAAERRMAPIYTLTSPAGIATRDQAVEYFRGLNLKHIDIADLRIDPEGADMVVSYVATLETNSSSSPARYYMTTVWQQANRGWIAICHTEVRASP